MNVSIVIPVCNAEATLAPLLDRLECVLEGLRPRVHAYEVILVDDGSGDGSWSAVEALAAEGRPPVRGIRLMRNYGQHAALLCGIRAAQHDVTVTMDDDLQHPPEEIPRLLDALGDDTDVVYGTPRGGGHGLYRSLASRMTKVALARVMGAETARRASAFRAFRTPLRDAFAECRSADVTIDVLLTWGTTRFSAVDVRHEPRRHGTSNYHFVGLVDHGLDMLTGFSTHPLRLASVLGVVLAMAGAVGLVVAIARFTAGGVALLASLGAAFAGVQLLALGILGEYLGRVHLRTMDRPPYAVRTRTEPVEARATTRRVGPTA